MAMLPVGFSFFSIQLADKDHLVLVPIALLAMPNTFKCFAYRIFHDMEIGIGTICAFCFCGDDPIGFTNYGHFSSLGLVSKVPLDTLFFFIGMSNVAILEFLVGKAPFDGWAPMVTTMALQR